MTQESPPDRIVVVGASAGGIEAVCTLLAGLPGDFRFAIFVVVHINRTRSQLAQVFSRCGKLVVTTARHGEAIRGGCVYVAPPNRHLLIEDSHIVLSHGPLENRFRPAVDPLFRTAARAYRNNAIGIVLSGALDDGTAGAFAIKARGGIVIIQDPADAIVSNMPTSARERVDVDYCLPAAKIAPLLAKLSLEDESMPSKDAEENVRQEPLPNTSFSSAARPSEHLVPFVCPDCSGPMYEVKNDKLVQFTCLIGHAYSPASLDAAHLDALERAIWVAVRTLKERLNVQRALAGNRQSMEPAVVEHINSIENDIAMLEQILRKI